MNDSKTKFDSEELLHLGMRASLNRQHAQAIAYFKLSLEQTESANGYFLLAAEHAEIGMYDRALEEMQKATELNPELWIAHFQRGLLLTTLNRVGEALSAWTPMDKLPEEDPLQLFRQGLSKLLDNRLQEAQELLMEGMKKNTSNAPLNNNMAQIVERIRNASNKDAPAKDESEVASPQSARDYLIKNYKGIDS